MRIFNTGYSTDFDGPGTRLIYYLKGCNFRCDWCGAPESISPETQILRYPDRTAIAGSNITPEEILEKVLAARDFISGVTFGGGEPTLQCRELAATLGLLRKNNIHTAMESNASTPGFLELAVMVDWLFSDLKTLDKNKFRKRVNPDVEYVEIVRANLCFAAEHQSNLVIRIPVIAGLNDEDGAQNQLLDFCRELSALRRNGVLHVQLLRQHHLGNVKYQALGLQCRCENTEPPPRENLERFAEKLNANGIKVSLFG